MKKHGHFSKRHMEAKVLAGLFVILFGSLFLMKQSGVVFEPWVLSWKTIAIAAGIVTLYRHRFKTFFGYGLIVVGGAFILDDYYPQVVDTKLILPILVILFGVMMIGKATNLFGMRKKKSHHVMFDEDIDVTSDDYIEASTYFGGVNKNVTSKDFKGANISTVFGGMELNLSKADIQHPIVIETSTTFGGLKLIVPSNWQVNSEIQAVFGGVEDKRGTPGDHQIDEQKTVTLKGNCVFGGVEIQSYI